MHPLFSTLLQATSHWLDGLTSARLHPAEARCNTPAQAAAPRLPLVNAPVRPCAPDSRVRLGPTRRLARMRSAPDDVCLTVISGRMVDVCELLDQMVAREAALR
jgi:hypothetical protein